MTDGSEGPPKGASIDKNVARIPLSSVALPRRKPPPFLVDIPNTAAQRLTSEQQAAKLASAEVCESSLQDEYEEEFRALRTSLKVSKIGKGELAAKTFSIEPHFRSYLLTGKTPNPQPPAIHPNLVNRISTNASEVAIRGLGLQYIRDFGANDTDPRTLEEVVNADRENVEKAITNAQASGQISDRNLVDDLRKVAVTLQGQEYSVLEANEILLRLQANIPES